MFVLDASVVMKWFVEEEDTKKALRYRDKHKDGSFDEKLYGKIKNLPYVKLLRDVEI